MARPRSKRISRRRARLRLLLIPAALLGLFVLLFFADAALSSGRIHSGISIAGVDFGRVKAEEAVARLAELVDETMAKPLVLTRHEYRWPVLPGDLGAALDVHATVDEAMAVTRRGNILKRLAASIALYFRPRDVPLEGTVNYEHMDKIIDLVAEKLDRPPVNAGLKFDGDNIIVIQSKDGLVVDRPALRNQLHDVLLSLHSTDVPIPMIVRSPNVQAADTAGAIEAARAMVASPVTLAYGEARWTMSVETLKLALDFTVAGAGAKQHLVPYVSSDKAADFFGPIAEAVKTPPRKATWQTDGETATLVPAVFGKELDGPATADAVTKAATSATNRVATVAVKETAPERTTEQAQAMGIVKSIGSYTTEFTGSANRISNIQRAANLISGTLVGPGDTFSFNAVVGRRTEERGFKTAPAIKEDGTLEDDLGGGICQVATTLFNAAFFAGLPITERQNHLLYIDHYPMGRDAAVSWGYPDLKFRNDTDHWLLIKSHASNSSVTFVIYGTPDGRKVTYKTSDWYDLVKQTEKRQQSAELLVGETKVKDYGQDGRSCTVTRTVTRNGETLRKDSFPSIYPMVPKLILEGTKPKETTTTTKPTTTTGPLPTTSTTSPPTTNPPTPPTTG